MTYTIGQRAIRHLQEMYPTAHGALHQSGRTSLRNTVDMAAARQEKDAFRAGWITNAGHSDGNYLTSCMEGDYALYQQHGTDYFAEAWVRALGHDDEEPTPSPADLLVAKIAKGPEPGESITRWMDKMMLEARAIAGKPSAPGAPPRPPLTDEEVKDWIVANWQHSWWGLMDCDRCPSRAARGAPCNTCGRWPHWIKDHRQEAEAAKEA